MNITSRMQTTTALCEAELLESSKLSSTSHLVGQSDSSRASHCRCLCAQQQPCISNIAEYGPLSPLAHQQLREHLNRGHENGAANIRLFGKHTPEHMLDRTRVVLLQDQAAVHDFSGRTPFRSRLRECSEPGNSGRYPCNVFFISNTMRAATAGPLSSLSSAGRWPPDGRVHNKHRILIRSARSRLAKRRDLRRAVHPRLGTKLLQELLPYGERWGKKDMHVLLHCIQPLCPGPPRAGCSATVMQRTVMGSRTALLTRTTMILRRKIEWKTSNREGADAGCLMPHHVIEIMRA